MRKKIIIASAIIIIILFVLFIVGIFVERSSRRNAIGSSYFPTITSKTISENKFKKNSFGLEAAIGISEDAAFAPQETPKEISGDDSVDRMIIKNSNLSLEVENVQNSVEKIKTLSENNGGFVVTSNIYQQKNNITNGSITFRIPAEKFDTVLNNVRTIAKKVILESINGKDVTEEYLDNQAQLKNLESTETQFREILTKAKTIQEILQVQNELNNIRGQIESLKGRMQYLEKSVKLSSITVNLSTDQSSLPVVKNSEWKLGDIIKNATRGLLFVFKIMIYILIWIGVFSIIWIPFWLIIRRIIKNWRRKIRS